MSEKTSQDIASLPMYIPQSEVFDAFERITYVNADSKLDSVNQYYLTIRVLTASKDGWLNQTSEMGFGHNPILHQIDAIKWKVCYMKQ